MAQQDLEPHEIRGGWWGISGGVKLDVMIVAEVDLC